MEHRLRKSFPEGLDYDDRLRHIPSMSSENIQEVQHTLVERSSWS